MSDKQLWRRLRVVEAEYISLLRALKIADPAERLSQRLWHATVAELRATLPPPAPLPPPSKIVYYRKPGHDGMRGPEHIDVEASLAALGITQERLMAKTRRSGSDELRVKAAIAQKIGWVKRKQRERTHEQRQRI